MCAGLGRLLLKCNRQIIIPLLPLLYSTNVRMFLCDIIIRFLFFSLIVHSCDCTCINTAVNEDMALHCLKGNSCTLVLKRVKYCMLKCVKDIMN